MFFGHEPERVLMKLDSSLKSYALFSRWMSNDVEEVWVAALDCQLQIIEKKMIFRGTVDSCHFHPREIIRFLCLQNASSFIMAHNHPSGNPKPSNPDIKLTKKIFELSKLLEIPIQDHLIVAGKKYFSFADSGALYRLELSKLSRLR